MMARLRADRRDPRQGEEDRGRGRRRPHHAGGRRRADRGVAAVSEKLRILVTGFGPFPGAPYNPTQPLVARLTRLRRPAFADVELSSHIFPVTYKAVDRRIADGAGEAQAARAADVRPRRPHRAYVRIETRARNAVTMLWPDAAQTRVRKGSIADGADALRFGPHTAKLLRAAQATGIDARASRDAGSYLCNYLSWRAIEAVEHRQRPAPRRLHSHSAAGARRRGQAQGFSAHHAGRTGRCRRSDADGDGEAGAQNFVGWAKRLVRRSSNSEGGSVPTISQRAR